MFEMMHTWSSVRFFRWSTIKQNYRLNCALCYGLPGPRLKFIVQGIISALQKSPGNSFLSVLVSPASARMSPSLPAGARLGRYEIRSQLGVGGMGEVYLAEDAQLRRRVALKILPGELAANQDRMRRFIQEAQAEAALNHPNIAHIYEIGESEGTNFIAMEFVDGKTLREKIHQEKSELRVLLKHL
jgi:serine/threonine protein kinase